MNSKVNTLKKNAVPLHYNFRDSSLCSATSRYSASSNLSSPVRLTKGNVQFPPLPSQELRKTLQPILDAIGDVSFVLLGEETHGTEEFYRFRAELSRLLVLEKGFNIIAVEADWPDAYRVNRYITANKKNNRPTVDKTAVDALCDFQRFPQWMWRNECIVDMTEWLRAYNDWVFSSGAEKGTQSTVVTDHRTMEGQKKNDEEQSVSSTTTEDNKPAPETLQEIEKKLQQKKWDEVTFYGLDLYSLNSSIRAVINYLNIVDPKAAEKAKERYSRLEKYKEDASAYAVDYFNGLLEGVELNVQKGIIQTLKDLRKRMKEYLDGIGGFIDGDEYFYTEQNADIVIHAEEYYRNLLISGGVSTWNIRDKHMFDCMLKLIDFKKQSSASQAAKVIIWAHNSHLGDSRATDMGESGEWNLGQLIRQHVGEKNVFSLGFSTYQGHVTAAPRWGAPPRFFALREGMKESYEYLFHSVLEEIRKDQEQMDNDTTPSTSTSTSEVERRKTVRRKKDKETNESDGNSSESDGEKRGKRRAREKSERMPMDEPKLNTLLFVMHSKDPNHPQTERFAQTAEALKGEMYERAVGVEYRRDTEFRSHYFQASLSHQFDAVVHVDTSHALTPLDLNDQWLKGRMSAMGINQEGGSVDVPQTSAKKNVKSNPSKKNTNNNNNAPLDGLIFSSTTNNNDGTSRKRGA